MNELIKSKLELNYKPLIKEFVESIKNINVVNQPEPCLPVIGQNYGKKYPKILFWGWETRDARSLEKWLDFVKEDEMDAFEWVSDEFNDFEFVYWRSNFNNDFWSFNLKVLGKLYGLEDWRELYRNPNNHSEILSSFAWANTDSIERYEVTAQKLGADYESWKQLKKASTKFDSAKLIIDCLEPDLIILENWNKEEDWLLNGLKIIEESEPQQFLWHYKFEKPNTQLFWTKHPRGHNSLGIDQEQVVTDIQRVYELNR